MKGGVMEPNIPR